MVRARPACESTLLFLFWFVLFLCCVGSGVAYLQGSAALDADNRFAIIHDRPPERGRAIKVFFFFFTKTNSMVRWKGGFGNSFSDFCMWVLWRGKGGKLWIGIIYDRRCKLLWSHRTLGFWQCWSWAMFLVWLWKNHERKMHEMTCGRWKEADFAWNRRFNKSMPLFLC